MNLSRPPKVKKNKKQKKNGSSDPDVLNHRQHKMGVVQCHIVLWFLDYHHLGLWKQTWPYSDPEAATFSIFNLV